MLLETYLTDFLQNLSETFTSPKKRVFIGYLLSGFAMGMAWLYWRKKQSLKESWQRCFAKEIWWTPSAKADYQVMLLNKLTFLFLAPLLLTQMAVATWLFQTLYEVIGHRPIFGSGWPTGSIPLLFTLCYLLLDDFFRYYLHKLLHEVPALWAFHKVHHSARTMTPLTVFRAHPVEGVLFSLRTAIVQAVSIAGFVFFFGPEADLVTVWGASIFAFLFNLTGSNLRHSHVNIAYWPKLEKFLISPAMHQIHHSTDPKHFDKNYGVILAVWDRMGGTLVHGHESEGISYGLSRKIKADEQSLKSLYLLPFKESASALVKSLSRLKPFKKSQQKA